MPEHVGSGSGSPDDSRTLDSSTIISVLTTGLHLERRTWNVLSLNLSLDRPNRRNDAKDVIRGPCGWMSKSKISKPDTPPLMANIAEGFSRKSDKEFGQFLFIAKSSVADLQSHAYVALDQKFISEPEFKLLYAVIDHECRMVSNLIKHLSRTH